MKIALFESSCTMREITKKACSPEDTQWVEFEYFGETGISSIQGEKYDAIITSKEFAQGSLADMVKHTRGSKLNKETPIFLFTSDLTQDAMDHAFDLGVTDVFFKQELPALADTLAKIATFPKSVEGAKVLLVEDNKAVSDYYCKILKSINCIVIQTDNCNQADEILKTEAIELVVTDLNLEGGGQGQRIIHSMRHNETVILNKIPIMVLSGINTLQVQTGLFFLGIDDFLMKPVLPLQFSLRAINLIKKFRVYQQAEQHASELRNIAHYDKLTKIYNRHGFEDIATFCVANCQRQVNSVLGVMYIDLDNFKPVNDNHGHDVGDEVLVKVANELKVLLRDQDVLARWGGDEFVVLLNQCDIRFIQAICNRVKEAFERKSSEWFGVTASVGLAYGEPRNYQDVLGYIKQADNEMYDEKKEKVRSRMRSFIEQSLEDKTTIINAVTS
jgi:two-component system cell cycle response regulator